MDDVLSALLSVDAPSGFEEPVRLVLKKMLEDRVDFLKTDNIGNIVATKQGVSDKSILLVAHMDEVGFMVQHVYEDGFLKVVPLGGWDERILPDMEVKILANTPVYGVVASTPPHITNESERSQAVRVDSLYVDTGFSRKELVDEGVVTGVPIVPCATVRERADLVMSKALDDRAGCRNLVKLAETLTDSKLTIHYVATVQEEVGCRGASVIANTIKADYGVVLEATVAADQPGLPEEKRPARMGEGAALTVMDRSLVADPRLTAVFREAAKKNSIPYQIKKPAYGGTDGGALHLASQGIPFTAVSVPCRYIHSSHSIMSSKDADSVVRLVESGIRLLE